MRIQHNIMAVNTHRQLGINNSNQAKSTEKLSSGYRINRAADDAAGLYISEKMRAQVRGLNQASANAQDGISLIQAAEGALQETHSILQRMRELAVKAANDVNETEDRGAIKSEINALVGEIDRIAYATEFNKKILLNGSLSNQATYATTTAPLSGLYVKPGATKDIYTLAVSIEATTATFTASASMGNAAKVATDGAIDVSDVLDGSRDGQTALQVQLTSGMTADEVANKIVATINSRQDSLYRATSNGSGGVDFTARETGTVVLSDGTGAGRTVTIGLSGIQIDNGGTTFSPGLDMTGAVAGDAPSTISGTGQNASNNLTLRYNDATKTFADAAAGVSFKWTGSQQPLTQGSYTLVISEGKSLTLQVGANTGSIQTIGIAITNLTAAGLGLTDLKVNNHANSQMTIDAVENAIANISEQRSGLGAVQNRLEHTVANLDTVSENLQSAESRIRDVDMAKEMLEFTKNNILTQAATAMLAQANQAPQTVLQLLR